MLAVKDWRGGIKHGLLRANNTPRQIITGDGAMEEKQRYIVVSCTIAELEEEE